MKARERVSAWLRERDVYGDVVALFEMDQPTGTVHAWLRDTFRETYRFTRDDLEIWRRWAMKQQSDPSQYHQTPPITNTPLYRPPHTLTPPPAHSHSEPIPHGLPGVDHDHDHPVDEPPKIEAKLYAILPDQQIPYHDPILHELVLRWLDANKPFGKVYSGDIIDLPGLSRHDWNPNLDSNPLLSTAAAIRKTRAILAEYREASGEGDDWLLEGNHEYRLKSYVIKHAPALFALEEFDGGRTLDLSRILNLDLLGVRTAGGDWPHSKLWLSNDLAVMHGWLARSRSGYTATGTLDHLGHSVIVGHTHRQGQVFKTRHVREGVKTYTALEAGTLAIVEGGLGYAVAPDWQPGFATVYVYEDGTFSANLATYAGGALRWQDQVYRHNGVRGVHAS